MSRLRLYEFALFFSKGYLAYRTNLLPPLGEVPQSGKGGGVGIF